jgi:WD40 repeat protein
LLSGSLGASWLTFSPGGDLLAAGSNTGLARVWRTATGQPQGPPRPHAPGIGPAAFQPPHGRLLATAAGGSIYLWESRSGRQSGPSLQHPEATIAAFTFDPSGRQLAAAGGPLIVGWGVERRRPTFRMRHTAPVDRLAFDPTGRTLATSGGGVTQFWRTASGQSAGPPLPGASPERVAFVDMAGQYVFQLAPGSVRLWRVGNEAAQPLPFQVDGPFTAVASNLKRQLLATAGPDPSVRIWRPLSAGVAPAVRVAVPNPRALCFARAGGALGIASDHDVRWCDRPTWNGARFGLPGGEQPWRVEFSEGGRLLAASLSGTRLVEIWETRSGRRYRSPLRHPVPVIDLRFSPGGRFLATELEGGAVYVWPLQSQHPEPVRLPGPARRLLAFSPDGRLLATTRDGEVSLWDVAGQQWGGPPLAHQNPVVAAAFDPGGDLLAVAAGPIVRLWETRRWLPRGDLQHPVPVQRLAFSPAGDWLATTADDNAVRLWSASDRRQRGAPLLHPDSIHSLVAAPDGKRLATGAGAIVRLWDLEAGLPYGPPLVHPVGAPGIHFSPDGRWLATRSPRAVWLWQVSPPVPELPAMGRLTGMALAAWPGRDGRPEAIPWTAWAAMRRRFSPVAAAQVATWVPSWTGPAGGSAALGMGARPSASSTGPPSTARRKRKEP